MFVVLLASLFGSAARKDTPRVRPVHLQPQPHRQNPCFESPISRWPQGNQELNWDSDTVWFSRYVEGCSLDLVQPYYCDGTGAQDKIGVVESIEINRVKDAPVGSLSYKIIHECDGQTCDGGALPHFEAYAGNETSRAPWYDEPIRYRANGGEAYYDRGQRGFQAGWQDDGPDTRYHKALPFPAANAGVRGERGDDAPESREWRRDQRPFDVQGRPEVREHFPTW